MMIRTAILSMFLFAAAPALADSYSAIAVDPDKGAYGASVHATKAEAESRATAECKSHGGGSACNEQVWTHNGCVSLAYASKSAWGVGGKASADSAKEGAVRKCVETGGSKDSCKLVATLCAH